MACPATGETSEYASSAIGKRAGGGHRWRIDSQAIDTLTQYVRASAYVHRYMNFDQISEFVEQAATVEM